MDFCVQDFFTSIEQMLKQTEDGETEKQLRISDLLAKAEEMLGQSIHVCLQNEDPYSEKAALLSSLLQLQEEDAQPVDDAVRQLQEAKQEPDEDDAERNALEMEFLESLDELPEDASIDLKAEWESQEVIDERLLGKDIMNKKRESQCKLEEPATKLQCKLEQSAPPVTSHWPSWLPQPQQNTSHSSKSEESFEHLEESASHPIKQQEFEESASDPYQDINNINILKYF